MPTPTERRQDALEKFRLVFDNEFAELCVYYGDTPIVMIRGTSVGLPNDAEIPAHFPPEGRFALFSWDNDDPEGIWSGNLTNGVPLWESSLVWPPTPEVPQ